MSLSDRSHPAQPRLNRRDWLAASGMAAAAVWLPATTGMATDPISRNGKSHLKLSLAAYSFNRMLLRNWLPEQITSAKYTLEQFIDFCADQQLDGCELTSYYFPKDPNDEYLTSLKEQTFRLGLGISGTAIGNDFCVADANARKKQLDSCKEWIDRAAVLGAPVIRIFAGELPSGDSEDAARERCVDLINQALDHAAKRGVFLALENHGGITATPEQLLKIVTSVKPSPWFGVNFDGGNFKTDDPYRDLAKIAPYTINAQIKVEISPPGGGKKTPADLPRMVKILKDAGYRGYVVLEYEAAEDPLVAVPKYLQQLRELIHA